MAARIVAQNRWPYLSSQLFSLKLVEVSPDELPTMAVDKWWRMYYSPQFVLNHPVEVLATALLHEALHCVMKHNERYDDLGTDKGFHAMWNHCADAAINEILDGQSMPWGEFSPVRYEGFPIPGVISGMATESAYRICIEWASNHREESEAFTSECGSSAGGETREYELPIEDDEAPGIGKERQDAVRDQVAADIAKHASARSNIPGGLKRWAEDYLNPQVDWRKHLAVEMRQVISNVSGRRNHSYQRPSRRQDAIRAVDETIVLPGLKGSEPPRVAVIVDTSGSVSSKDLNVALGEIHGITRAVGMKEPVAVIACDAQAYPVQYVRSATSIKNLELTGGGGTDLRHGINAALALPKRPQLVIVVSDGDSPFSPESPDPATKFIMLLTVAPERQHLPSWMKSVQLET